MRGEGELKGVEIDRDGEALRLRLVGEWSIYSVHPGFDEILAGAETSKKGGSIEIDCSGVENWDSRLLVFLLQARAFSRCEGWTLRLIHLPDGVRKLLEQVPEDIRPSVIPKTNVPLAVSVGEYVRTTTARAGEILAFTGDIVGAAGNCIRHPRRFRWGDCLEAMQKTGALALPIVGLISLLVGVIMAFQAAIQLRMFGAEIFVANLVGLAVVREMGPLMAAIVLCGRTGAAFAAEIGTMKVNEEIDALKTLGASPVDFLVMPRMVALFVMMPLLVIYANFLGIMGGLFIGVTTMDMTAATYIAQTREAITLPDVYTGLIKGVAFGGLIAFSGCLRGLQCKRSSAGVGAAATSAVVTGILLVIVADALFAVIFDRVGL